MLVMVSEAVGLFDDVIFNSAFCCQTGRQCKAGIPVEATKGQSDQKVILNL